MDDFEADNREKVYLADRNYSQDLLVELQTERLELEKRFGCEGY